MKTFSAVQNIDVHVADYLRQTEKLRDWATQATYAMLKAQGLPMIACLKQLWRAELEPRLHVKTVVARGQDGQLLLEAHPTIEVEHFAAATDPRLQRAPEAYWEAVDLLYNYRQVYDAITEHIDELSDNEGEELREAVDFLRALQHWGKEFLDRDRKFRSDARFPSPASQSQREEYDAFERFCDRQKLYRNDDALAARRPQELDKIVYSIALPEETAAVIEQLIIEGSMQVQVASTAIQEEAADGNEDGSDSPEGESLRLRWSARRKRKVFGGALAAVLLLGVIGWQGWIWNQQFNPSAVSLRLSTVANIYNLQQLFFPWRARALAVESPRVFEHFTEELYRLVTKNQVPAADYDAFINVLEHVPSYMEAFRYRRALYERALAAAAQMDFPRQPVHALTVDAPGGRGAVTVSVSDLDLSQPVRPQVIDHLRQEWERTGDMLDLLSHIRPS